MTYARYYLKYMPRRARTTALLKPPLPPITITTTTTTTATTNHNNIPVKEFSSDIGKVGSAKKSKRLKNANPTCELRDYCRQKPKGET